MFSSRGTVRYEERGEGYRDVEKVGKHWYKSWFARPTMFKIPVCEIRPHKCTPNFY